MRVTRRQWDGSDEAALASELRAGIEAPGGLREDVAEIIEQVRSRGDEAVLELTARFDATESSPESIRVGSGEIDAALAGADPDLVAAMKLAAENLGAVAAAELEIRPASIELVQGHRVTIVEPPVRAAGIYAPGGRAAYPSSVLMGAVPAVAAGVARIALASPPGPDGSIAAPTLVAASIAGVSEVYAMGGAQAIAALALGTETIERVDVLAGPGNAWVTEAKRQLFGTAGVDGLAGPSELVVVADAGADARAIALDLLAQSEHGPDSPLILIADDDSICGSVAAAVEVLEAERPSSTDARLELIVAPDLNAALELSDAIAPEHLELRFEDAIAEVGADRIAGAVFVGSGAATAFGDYAAGSNHVLPTGGAARFSGPLGPRAFLRRTSVVSVPAGAAEALAPAVDEIARAEGLPVHGESALAAGGMPPPDDPSRR
jgi:histidinol dehydrogenase